MENEIIILRTNKLIKDCQNKGRIAEYKSRLDKQDFIKSRKNKWIEDLMRVGYTHNEALTQWNHSMLGKQELL